MSAKIENIAAYNLDSFIEKYGDRLIIWDVRSELEYVQGHIIRARNVPYERVINALKSLKNDKIVLVYCSRGGRSIRVAKILFLKGYRVVNVVGGIKEYNGKNIIK